MIEQFVTRWAILGTGVVSRKFVLGLRPLGGAARVSTTSRPSGQPIAAPAKAKEPA